jgi:hypothetical protein
MPSKLADRTDDERGDGSFGLTGPGILIRPLKQERNVRKGIITKMSAV